MPEHFPPDDFDGYEYPEEFSTGEFNSDDFFLMSEDEFLSKNLNPPIYPDEADDYDEYLEELGELGFIITDEDEIHGDIFSEPSVTVLKLNDVEPGDLRRHIFPDVQGVLNWLKRTGLINIGSIVDLGGGLYGVAVGYRTKQ